MFYHTIVGSMVIKIKRFTHTLSFIQYFTIRKKPMHIF